MIGSMKQQKQKPQPRYKPASALRGAISDLGMAAKLIVWGYLIYLILKSIPL